MASESQPSAPTAQPPDFAGAEAEVTLVQLRRRHLRSVLKIEQQVYPRPWTVGVFMSELNLRSQRHYVAARADGRLIGYAGLMFGYEEAHVTNIAVDPQWQRHRVATRLLVNLFHAAVDRGADGMTLEVRVSNTGAQALYKRFGFEVEGLRKNYYVETNEDALVMWVRGIGQPERLAELSAIEETIAATTHDETVGGRCAPDRDDRSQ